MKPTTLISRAWAARAALHAGPPPRLMRPLARFSTGRPRLTKPPSSKPANPNPEYPPFSFEALGISRNMKLVIIGLLSVFGTLESWFWCKAIWRWWKGGDAAAQPESSPTE